MEFSYIVYSELAETWLSALTAMEKPCLIISDGSLFLLISFDLKEDWGGGGGIYILVCSTLHY